MRIFQDIKTIYSIFLSYRVFILKFTFNCSSKWNQRNHQSSNKIHNTEILDEDKADNSALDIPVANVYDDTAVEQDSDYDDDDYKGTLKSLRDDKDFAKSIIQK